jgi:hypothetical protein
VVEHSTKDSEIEGFNPACGTGAEKEAKSLYIEHLCPSSTTVVRLIKDSLI